MNAKQKLHQIHLQEWTVRFADQKASGLTVRQWCEQNNLSFHTYNYWKHLLKEEVVDQALPDIVPITLPVLSDSDTSLETSKTEVRSIRANRAIRSNDNSNVKVLVNGISIETSADVSAEFLGYTDLRFGIDSLAAIITSRFHMQLFVPNTLFLFCGRSSTRIKGLLWEGDGFLLLYKRVESGHFTWPRSSAELRSLSAEQFHWLMQGFAIDPVIHDITPDSSI